MAVNTKSRYSCGGVVGVPKLVQEFNKFANDALPKYRLGFKVEDGDGNVYRYAHFQAAITKPGYVVAQDFTNTSVADSNNIILAPASCQNTNDCKAGSYFVELTKATITENQFAGGKFIITDDTGEGYTYDIKRNTATGNPASGNIRLELKQKLQVALDATSDFCIIGNKYQDLVVATSDTDNILAGVSCGTMTADYYGWIQTRGICGIIEDDTTQIAIGDQACVSETAGTVEKIESAAAFQSCQVVGVCLVAGDDGGLGAYSIYL